MGYRRFNNNRYTNRYRTDAWYEDGGANDEGYYYAYCPCCNRRTEHQRGGDCIACADKAIRRRR